MSTPKVLTALDVKNRFGEAVLSVQSSPVTVTKNGKPVLVMISMQEYEQMEAFKKKYVDEQIALGLKDIKEGRIIDAKTFFDDLLAD